MANIFTEAGEAFIADLVDGTVTKPANYYVAWGTGAGTAAKADTTLFTESAEEVRTAATLSQPAADTNRFVGRIEVATSNKTITNAGVLTEDGTPAGILLLKSDFTGLPLNIGDSVEFTFDLVWS
jgi:hypothetical protein